MLFIPNEVFIQFHESGCYLMCNPFSKTWLSVDGKTLELMNDVAADPSFDCMEKYKGTTFQVQEVGFFSNERGLLADPTRLYRDVSEWPDVKICDANGLIEILLKHCLVIDDMDVYFAKFGMKTSLVDFDHFGNFHQQLGQHLLLVRRDNPEKWWFGQKFTDELTGIRRNLYKAIQESFLKSYFPKRFSKGDMVVDLGCGVGYYADMMASTGAEVLAVDPNPDYLELASRRKMPGVTYKLMDIGACRGLDEIPSHSADFVFMSDALLFYFYPERPSQQADLQVLLRDLRRILKPNGIFISLEPHFVFWLTPWLGEPQRPFTFMTEYRSKSFGVVPTLGEAMNAFFKEGFVLTRFEELYPADEYKDQMVRAWNYASQFPLWHLFEFRNDSNSG